MGYKLFIVPGSSFIKRIIKKHQSKAIIGVGCQMEIKKRGWTSAIGMGFRPLGFLYCKMAAFLPS